MSSGSRTLILYSTPACHLCETALALITPYLDKLAIFVEEIDISESDELITSYGIRIPVLKFSEGEDELSWPFTAEEFLAYAVK